MSFSWLCHRPLLATAIAALTLAGQVAAEARVERRLVAMGTELRVTVVADRRSTAVAASERAVLTVERVEGRLSTWRETSELARLNRAPTGTPVLLSRELAADLGRARELWLLTDGAFDPAVGALVATWDLRGSGRVPGTAELAAARAGSGFHQVLLEGEVALRRSSQVRLEEGGFGKGVALDAAAGAALEGGATCAVLELGGQVLVAGRCRPLPVAVAAPRQRSTVVAEALLAAGSLATSGNSERGLVVDGMRIGHILDPRSGRPAPDFGSVTAWAADATTADALATALFVMGPEVGMAWLEGHDDVEALFLVAADGPARLLASSGMAAVLTVGAGGLGGSETRFEQRTQHGLPLDSGGLGGDHARKWVHEANHARRRAARR